MNIQPKLGLVTVLFNGKDLMEGFFKSLEKQTYKNFTLYIIDNTPHDEVIDEARKYSEICSVDSVFIKNDVNCGVARGNNQGINAALNDGCDYILLLNNDIEFSGDTISLLMQYLFDNDENIIVPKIYFHGTDKLWYAGGRIREYVGYVEHYGYEKSDEGRYDTTEYVNYAPTCFMIVNKCVFEKVGMMDEDYFVYFDDTDFVLRCNEKGYAVVYYPEAVVQHKVSVSSGGSESNFSIYYLNRNRLYFIVKHSRNLKKVSCMVYYMVTRAVKYLSYGAEQRKLLLDGVKAGWDLSRKIK